MKDQEIKDTRRRWRRSSISYWKALQQRRIKNEAHIKIVDRAIAKERREA